MATATPDGITIPDREEVLGQSIPFDRTRWLPLLPDPGWWAPELDECPTIAGRRRVDRRTVFAVASRADTPEGRRHLLTAALAWGTGTKARSVARCAKIFAEADAADRINEHLASALDVLRNKTAVEAYYAFNNDDHIAYLGPAFFTKVLYFAGHERPTGTHRPLVLDRLVAIALQELTGDTWPTSGWKTPWYNRYLTVAHELAQRADVLPDQIEAALFARGKELSKRRPTP
ncbi:hypothetical protein [Streptomyces sp. MJP52]|uniref:8-oxoguanine DNA glycosylase OGG fold protein n=1 Tax=Streptomyces sp. MJP52 TaxID=2940555 RepID=UPI0024733C2C|nr:hypothetical protein [Streptomyces sp. MJP52]MDH6228169.1 hypothetical protein [Streptomyces sp. MJP52]